MLKISLKIVSFTKEIVKAKLNFLKARLFDE